MREKQIHERYKTLAGQIRRYRDISDSINEDKIDQFKYGYGAPSTNTNESISVDNQYYAPSVNKTKESSLPQINKPSFNTIDQRYHNPE